jgi:hypothetical protein
VMRLTRFWTIALLVVLTLTACGGNSKPAATPAPPAQSRTPAPPAASMVAATSSSATETPFGTVSPAASAKPKASPNVNLAVVCPAATTTALGPNQFMTLDQLSVRYHCVVNQFPWPAAHVPDVDSIMGLWASAGVGDSVQVGVEYTGLAVLNECAWFVSWLDARKSGDTAQEQEALWAIVNITPNIPVLIPDYPADAALSSGPGTVSGIMRSAAQLGDTGTIQTFVQQQGCLKPQKWKKG